MAKPSYWQVTNPSGVVVVRRAWSRLDAIGMAFAPHLGMSRSVVQRLTFQAKSVAGWAEIEVSGWKVTPIYKDS